MNLVHLKHCAVCKKITHHIFLYEDRAYKDIDFSFHTKEVCINHHHNKEKIEALLEGVTNLANESPPS
jgi:hypothetical protein